LVRDFPEHYRYFAEREYTFNGIKQRNRNGMLLRDPSVDGIKTGHTNSAGYCLATSAKRDGMRLVTVVMGMSSERAREDATAALLNYGFNFFETASLFAAGQSLGETRVWKGQANRLAVGVARDIAVVVPRGRAALLQSQATVPVSVIAPVTQGAPIGTVNVTLEGKTLMTEPLYAQAAVEQAGFFGRLFDSVRMKFE
jgi:D-alanyl-D-alanine carboxypeptidase (penicillin-binding protein 5/6)